MADRWNEDQERGWRDEDRRAGRYGGERDQDREYGSGEGRSFSPRREYDRDRGGRDFTGPQYGAGGYTGYGDRSSGDRGYGERNYSTGGGAGGQGGSGSYGGSSGYGGSSQGYGQGQQGGQGGQWSQGGYGSGQGRYGRGGRYYGDDGRQSIYRDEAGSGRPEDRWDQAFQDRQEGHSEFGFGYDLGGQGRGGGQFQDRGFWGRQQDRTQRFFGGGEGAHRGRGPQGYKRSDDRINEDVHERLTEDPHIDASNITVAVHEGEVTLSGQVESREAKHHAEHLIEHLSGVKHVQNNLRVDQNARSGQSSWGDHYSGQQASTQTGQSGSGQALGASASGSGASTGGSATAGRQSASAGSTTNGGSNTATGANTSAPLGENTKLSDQASGKT